MSRYTGALERLDAAERVANRGPADGSLLAREQHAAVDRARREVDEAKQAGR